MAKTSLSSVFGRNSSKIKRNAPGEVEDAAGEAQVDERHNSPFSASSVRRLVRFYCILGIIPGSLSDDHCTFVVRWWKSLLVVLLLAILVIGGLILQTITNGFAAVSSELSGSTDRAVAEAEGYFSVVYMLVTMWANHVSFKQCYRINTRLAQSMYVQYPGLGPVLRHHVFMICAFLMPPLLYIVMACEDNGYCGDFQRPILPLALTAEKLVELLFHYYSITILSVAELAIGRLLQCLRATLSHALDDINSKRISIKEFCDRADLVRQCYGSIGKYFANSILLLVIMPLLHMIWQSYFLVSRFFSDVSLFSWQSLINIIYIFISLKRLAHLTGAVHEFKKAVDDSVEKLIDLEASAPDSKDRSSAVRMQKLLGDTRDGLSVRGFFIVDRIVFPELIGFYLTYLILLMEFRAGEDDGGNSAAAVITPMLTSTTTMASILNGSDMGTMAT